MSASSTIVCPNCGAVVLGRNGEAPRFCGQCGTTIAAPATPATPAQAPASVTVPVTVPAPAPALPSFAGDVHEEVTVAREMPELEDYLSKNRGALGQTMLDDAPLGAQAGAREPHAAALEALEPHAGAARTGAARTQLMAQTLNDPDAEARAREMVAAAIATPEPAPAARPAMNKTMMMGGDAASFPHAGGHEDEAASGRPTRSVLAGTLPLDAVPPSQALPSAAGSGVDVARVVSLGPVQEARAPVGMPKPTQLGMPVHPPAEPASAPGLAPSAPSPPSPLSPAQGPAGASHAHRTMLGMPAKDLPPSVATHGPGGGSPGPVAPGPPAAAAPHAPIHAAQKTMLGVAIPGIAPSQPAVNDAAHAHGGGPPPGAPGAPVDLRSKQSTMLGVAIPGIAPSQKNAPNAPAAAGPAAPYGYTAQGAPAPRPHIPSQVQNTALGMVAMPEVPIVPRPKTLVDEPLPAAPVIAPKKGVSALAVVGIVAGLVLVLGGALAVVALRRGVALTAVPQLDESGKESLKVACPSCPDGTTLSLGASTATVTAQNALLPLPAPLTIGDNDLTVTIDRPGAGRDEDVKIHVPVAYRVRADLTTLSAKPPAITVRVEAESGTAVTVDNQPVTLDATGKGAHAIDLAKETEGTGEAKPYERKIPFVITPKTGPAQTGELTARTAVLALALEAPGTDLYTDRTTAAVAGQTRAGATVTVDGQNVPVDAVGRFAVRVELPAVGPKPLEIIASGAPQAPRIARVKVTRVASLAEQAKELETRGPLTYDGFGANPAGAVGKAAVVEGEVVDARAGNGHTVLLVEAKRGCAKGASCLTRVLHGDEDKLGRGDTVRAYGVVKGAVTASGKTVPEIDASLVMTVKAAR